MIDMKKIPAGGCLCGKCSGSGKFYSGGAVVNGRYTGKVGVCFSCQGKGWQSAADRRRCAYYWDHVAHISL